MSKEFKIKEATQTMSARLIAYTKPNDKGVIEENAEKVFDIIAREDGRDPEVIRENDMYRTEFVNGLAHAVSVNTQSFMETHKDVNTVSGSFELGRATLDIVIERHQRVPNKVLDNDTGHFKTDGEKDLYGDMNLKFKMRGAQNSKGEIKAIRDFTHSNFKNAFGS